MMTDAELDERLAKALGWPVYFSSDGRMFVSPSAGDEIIPSSPSTDSNHLRLYVYPEIERRGLLTKFSCELAKLAARSNRLMDVGGFVYALELAPRVLAEAALEVLEGK